MIDTCYVKLQNNCLLVLKNFGQENSFWNQLIENQIKEISKSLVWLAELDFNARLPSNH